MSDDLGHMLGLRCHCQDPRCIAEREWAAAEIERLWILPAALNEEISQLSAENRALRERLERAKSIAKSHTVGCDACQEALRVLNTKEPADDDGS